MAKIHEGVICENNFTKIKFVEVAVTAEYKDIESGSFLEQRIDVFLGEDELCRVIADLQACLAEVRKSI